MTIIVYSEKKVVTQLILEYIERLFVNISYRSDIVLEQANERTVLETLLEEQEESATRLVIMDINRNEVNEYETLLNRENIILLTGKRNSKLLDGNSRVKLCDSLYQLEEYLIHWMKEKAGENTQEMLTKRELEILKLIAKGLLNKEIANELNITERTVKNHISNIFKKINVYDRTQAAVYAIKNNIFSI